MYVLRIPSSLSAFQVAPTVWVRKGRRVEKFTANLQGRMSPAQGSRDVGGGAGRGKCRLCTRGQSIQLGSRRAWWCFKWSIVSPVLMTYSIMQDHIISHPLGFNKKKSLKLGEILLNTSKGKFCDWDDNDVFHNL